MSYTILRNPLPEGVSDPFYDALVALLNRPVVLGYSAVHTSAPDTSQGMHLTDQGHMPPPDGMIWLGPWEPCGLDGDEMLIRRPWGKP